MQKKYFHLKQCPDWVQIANQSESFNDFIAYTILSESLFNMSFPRNVYEKSKHIFFGEERMFIGSTHQVILTGSKSYSFLSCYKENSYTAFSDPFDKFVWLSIFIIVFTFTLIRAMNTWAGETLDVSILSVAVILEISVTSNINRIIPKGLKHIFWIWVFCGIILTAVYKTIFTTEVILPYRRTPPWKRIYELHDQGFQFFFPVKPNEQQVYDWYINGTPTDTLSSFGFSTETIFASNYKGNFPRLLGYKRFAKALLVASDLETGGGSSSRGGNISRIWRDLHYRWPSHVYPNLSRCADKLAYLDKKENIKDIIPFLNDNSDGTVFMGGDNDDFFRTWSAIQIRSTPRRNFVLDRVKFLMVSGIYKWWEEWFSRIKPRKLFPYYANWTGPKFGALEKLDFTARVVTILTIWGVCCGFCVMVGIMEICNGQLYSMHYSL
ncbi:hypothetical protein Fcan01_28312 [Folsomia candida]|uniref:Uncharacterized protein n=1 Tax=Folsomia candida TaxID=158441 RepID=A0A226CW29_FOLCA|nr:hypothetical protein Fcan01_28312 [Folsomia candida]